MARLVSITAALILSGAIVATAAASRRTSVAGSKYVGTHKLIVAVKKNLAPAAEKKLAVWVSIRQNGGAPGGGEATPSKPLTALLDNSGLYRLKAEINSPCKGNCDASYRVSGSINHKLEVIPSCQLKGSRFVCSKIKIVKVY